MHMPSATAACAGAVVGFDVSIANMVEPGSLNDCLRPALLSRARVCTGNSTGGQARRRSSALMRAAVSDTNAPLTRDSTGDRNGTGVNHAFRHQAGPLRGRFPVAIVSLAGDPGIGAGDLQTKHDCVAGRLRRELGARTITCMTRARKRPLWLRHRGRRSPPAAGARPPPRYRDRQCRPRSIDRARSSAR